MSLDTKKRGSKVKKAFKIFGLTLIGILVLTVIFCTGYLLIGKGFIVKGNAIVGYLGNAEELTIPEKVFGRNITSIETSAFDVSSNIYFFNAKIVDRISHSEKAFKNYGKFHLKFIHPKVSNKIKKLTIPNTITDMHSSALSYMPLVETINLPTNLEFISGGLMQHCPNLKEINVPDSVTKINTLAFWNCTNLKTLKIPDTAEVHPTFLFGSVANIEYISYRNSYVNDDYVIFDGTILNYRGKITDGHLIIPNKISNVKIESIGLYSIIDNDDIYELTISEGITKIGGRNAFENCKNLEKVTLPESLEFLSHNAFKDCISLKAITIPAKVETLQGSSFDGCTNLKEITIKGKNTEIKYMPSLLVRLDPVICAPKGSLAQEFAEKNHLVFKVI